MVQELVKTGLLGGQQFKRSTGQGRGNRSRRAVDTRVFVPNLTADPDGTVRSRILVTPEVTKVKDFRSQLTSQIQQDIKSFRYKGLGVDPLSLSLSERELTQVIFILLLVKFF